MKLSSLLVIFTPLVASVYATPPSCVLSCINQYSRWCPLYHRDILCLAQNRDNIIECLETSCDLKHFEAARDHFLGVCLEFLESPFPVPPQLQNPIQPPTKHKPPKYGYRRKPKPLLAFDSQLHGSKKHSWPDATDPEQQRARFSNGDPNGVNGASSGLETNGASFENANADTPDANAPIGFELNDDSADWRDLTTGFEDDLYLQTQALSKFSTTGPPPHGKRLPNFSKKKLVNRFKTDQGISKSRLVSKMSTPP